MSSSAVGIVPGSGVTPLSICQTGLGGDPSGLCVTAQLLGATDDELAQVGTGMLDPEVLLDSLAGGSAPPVTVQSSTSDILLGGIGSGIDTLSDPVGGTGILESAEAEAGSLVTWLKTNWWVIAVVIVAILAVVAWGYGGFR